MVTKSAFQITTTSGRSLIGHSGVALVLIERPFGPVVRKWASHTGQNARLRAQCTKLRDAGARGIACPAVLAEGEQNERFFFEMEYVAGESLANAVLSGRDICWDGIGAQIRNLLDYYRGDSCGQLPVDAFSTKLEQIVERCQKSVTLRLLDSRISRIAAKLKHLDWRDVPQSGCHGDLTFENILVRPDGSLVFIDFDVPEQCSWQLDIAKMYQDILGHWCLRHLVLAEPGGVEIVNAQVRLHQVEGALTAQIESLVNGGRERIIQLVAFHLMRTLPYASDSRVPDYVVGRIEAVLNLAACRS